MSLSKFLLRIWYESHPIYYLLLPFSWIYRIIIVLRRRYLLSFCPKTPPVPIIIVGNLTVGGVGKTPLVIALAQKMQQRGLKIGIVSRGYGGQKKQFPYEVQGQDSAQEVGDEPLLLAKKTQCPVVIARHRMQAVNYLLKHHAVQLILSDDGLQHYRMPRSIEIAVIDGIRGLGNGACLPAGPLREPRSRLKEVDLMVVNEGQWDGAYSMRLIPGQLRQLTTGEVRISAFPEPVAAVAGIGHPLRFFNTLTSLGIEFTPYEYPDHYRFKTADLNYPEPFVIMTEKDAIKCTSFLSEKLYYLPVEAALDEQFWHALWSHQQLQGLV